MSRYLILFLLTAPFIAAGYLNALIAYKLSKSSQRKFIFSMIFWTVILLGIAGAQPLYEFLISNNFTDTEPLSLFDVFQITGIIVVILVANRTRSKVDDLEHRLQNLHQELSIRLSDTKKQ